MLSPEWLSFVIRVSVGLSTANIFFTGSLLLIFSVHLHHSLRQSTITVLLLRLSVSPKSVSHGRSGTRNLWVIWSKYPGCTTAGKERIVMFLLCSQLQLDIMISFHFSPQHFFIVLSRHEFISLFPHAVASSPYVCTSILYCQKSFITYVRRKSS